MRLHTDPLLLMERVIFTSRYTTMLMCNAYVYLKSCDTVLFFDAILQEKLTETFTLIFYILASQIFIIDHHGVVSYTSFRIVSSQNISDKKIILNYWIQKLYWNETYTI